MLLLLIIVNFLESKVHVTKMNSKKQKALCPHKQKGDRAADSWKNSKNVEMFSYPLAVHELLFITVIKHHGQVSF